MSWLDRLRTKPLPHQAEVLERIDGLKSVGLWLDPGLGKSKIVLDWVTRRYWEGTVDALLVVAPNGVHQAWIEDEVVAHLDAAVWVGSKVLSYHSSELRKEDVAKAYRDLKKHRGLIIVAMNYASVRTDRGGKLLANLVRNRKSCLVLDESTKIKGPGTKISKRLQAVGKHTEFKFALSGTPVTNKPFDLYAQLKFLDPDVWEGKNYGWFKNHFAEWEEKYGPGGKSYPKLTAYKNLDELYEKFHRLGIRMAKDDVANLPPKIYQRRYFEPTTEQRILVEKLHEELRVAIEDGTVTAPLAVQQLVRAQQISSGFVKDDTGKVRQLKSNPRLDLLRDLLRDETQQSIVWAKYRQEIDHVCELLGASAVRYDGMVTVPAKRRSAIEAFRRGDVQFFVANPATLSYGVTITEAKRVYYYSTGFKLEERLQSEDRCHRIGQDSTVIYRDLVGRGTVDNKILSVLRKGRSVASEITGDVVLDWLAPH